MKRSRRLKEISRAWFALSRSSNRRTDAVLQVSTRWSRRDCLIEAQWISGAGPSGTLHYLHPASPKPVTSMFGLWAGTARGGGVTDRTRIALPGQKEFRVLG